MTIRPARPGDEIAIARVHVDSWRTTYRGIVPTDVLAGLRTERREQYWGQLLRSPDAPEFVFVATDERGEVVGFASGGPARDAAPEYQGELYAIYLLEPHQGKGLGRALVRAVAQQLEAHHLGNMLVWVLSENPACRFYAAMGGVPVGEKPVTIGTAALKEVSYGWPDLAAVR